MKSICKGFCARLPAPESPLPFACGASCGSGRRRICFGEAAGKSSLSFLRSGKKRASFHTTKIPRRQTASGELRSRAVRAEAMISSKLQAIFLRSILPSAHCRSHRLVQPLQCCDCSFCRLKFFLQCCRALHCRKQGAPAFAILFYPVAYHTVFKNRHHAHGYTFTVKIPI